MILLCDYDIIDYTIKIMNKRSGLGKGLSALITESTVDEVSTGYLPKLPTELIVPNPYQPRIEINPDKLVELADSIREHGIIEPILVTRNKEGKYEIIAGERRWRAAQLAGQQSVPVVVKEATPKDMLELAVIENVQREDLNPFEEAMAFEQLKNMFSMTHEQIAKRVGLSRPAIANKIRLLTLPDEIKRGLLENKISEGHARALLSLKGKDTMIATYKIILRDHLSVRAVEELVRRLIKGQVPKERKTRSIELTDQLQKIESNLRQRLGTQVSFYRSKVGGKIVIPFKTEDQLHKILREIGQPDL